MRYNEETDYIEVLLNGIWVSCIPTYIQAVNILSFMQDKQWEFSAINASYAFSNDTILTLKAIPKTAGGSVTIESECFPILGKTKIKIAGRVYLYTAAEAIISLFSEDDTILYKYTTPTANSVWVDISATGNILGGAENAKIVIHLPCYANYTDTQIQLTTILIE